ncbi:uncharacterized protein LOC135950707 [Calliphora vicina]|uniref:uncharacterized protein LOC135950707 n=1 Tax=Calliphora vicina TaxID=7373 RepID=UPI00325AC13B
MTTKGSNTTSVLLATAQVKVQAANGEQLMLRALIDQGSQITTLSEEASQLLRLPKTKCKTEIHGLGGAVVGVSSSKTKLVLRPRFLSNNLVETEALILPHLTGAQPSHSFENDIEEWKNFILADPSFNQSDRIDIVIGGDIIPHIIKEGVHKKRGVLAQSTIFGWILSGVINKKTKPEKLVSATTINLERFWEIEEVSLDFDNHEEDEFCQELFKTTTKIDDSNRIVVNLPIKKDDNELGESKKQAVARMLSMEKKFNSNPKLKEQYICFMEEYEHLGHMKLTTNNSGKYYLPHQAVIRENSLTTKLRVVFDASAKTTNGKSLNDVMYTGPRLQKDIFDIIVKWRLWRYVVMADVEKMYRQVRVAEKDQKYQHILWRKNKNELIKEYKLTTITYGTSSAPFLAVRALFHIADTCTIPEIKNIIKEDFYMDDLMTGADTIKQCKYIQHSVLNHLASYGFNLRKWLSNEKQITENVCSSIMIQIKDDESIKTLGLQWDPVMDNFKFGINFSNNDKITKRHVLSEVAKIFDPLGWLSPVTVLAKLFIQKLWLLQNKWDEVIPDELNNEWQVFRNNISCLQEIRVPRWVQLTTTSRFELHGFADASEKAYAAFKCRNKTAVVKLDFSPPVSFSARQNVQTN